MAKEKVSRDLGLLERYVLGGDDLARMATSVITGGAIDRTIGANAARERAGAAAPVMAAGLGAMGIGAPGGQFLSALLPSAPGKTKPVPTPEEVAAAAAPAVAARAAPATRPSITAQDRAMAAIGTILSQPFTINEFQAATSALPAVAGASAKQSARDRLFGTASNVADMLYQANLARASKLTGEAKDVATLKATQDYQQSLLSTLGVDPSKAILAEQLRAQGDD